MTSFMRFIGAVLLITGTTIGAGMLALPVITSFGGFIPSVIIFITCYVMMLLSALFFLDVNLSFSKETNLVTMAEKTLGRAGKAVCWVLYLMLLYSLLAAYIAASAPLFQAGASALIPFKLPASAARFCLPVAFGSFLYLGTRGVDYMNRLLMIGLIVSYVAVVVFVPAHIQVKNLIHIDFSASLISVPVVLTSFGYHIIIPSLTTYLHHDRRLLRKAILWGSLLPALIYIVWQVIVIGTVPQASLSKAWLEGLAATVPLSEITCSPLVSKGALFFSFFAIVTSFLGVSLSLSDFLIDGLKLKKTWEGRLFAYLLTFMPPLIFVFSLQRGFYLALQYAGVIVALLLGIIPAAMASRLKKHRLYSSLKGKLLIFFVALLFTAVVVIDFLEKKGALQTFISAYLST